MSVLSGLGKGAKRRRRDERYFAAVGRQMLMHDRGWYFRQPDPATGMPPMGRAQPAPVEEFLRPEHRGMKADPGIDFRSFARQARRT